MSAMLGIVSQLQPSRPMPNVHTDVIFQGHFNGANGATAAVDASSIHAPLTFFTDGLAPPHPAVSLSTSFKKFGSASLYCNPDLHQGKVTAPPNDAYSELTNGDFTIEMFIRPKMPTLSSVVAENAELIGVWGTFLSPGSWRVRVTVDTTQVPAKMYFNYQYGDASAVFTPISNADAGLTFDNLFYHIAFSRYWGTLRFFVDGVMKAKGTMSGIFGHTAGSSGLSIGNDYKGGEQFGDQQLEFAGYMDEVRVTRGAWYRSDAGFAPPVAEFPDP